jgi:hypothetical protein
MHLRRPSSGTAIGVSAPFFALGGCAVHTGTPSRKALAEMLVADDILIMKKNW